MSVAFRDSYKRSDTPEQETTGLVYRTSPGTSTRTISNNGGYQTTTTTYGNAVNTNIRTGTPERVSHNLAGSSLIRQGGLQTSTTYTSGPTTTYTSGATRLVGGGYRTTTTTNGGVTRYGGNGYTTRTSQIGGPITTTEYTRQLSPTITTNRNVRASHVVGIKEGQSRFLEERYVGERITNVTTHALEERIISTAKPEMKSYIHEVQTYEDEPVIKEVVVEKEVEVLVEKRVPVEKYVDVEYEVIVEKPIEKIIEKEIEIEKIMEREIEKIVEIPIERIVEIPIEKIVEKPVEIEKRVEVPYERIVERKIEDIHENLVYHDQYLSLIHI